MSALASRPTHPAVACARAAALLAAATSLLLAFLSAWTGERPAAREAGVIVASVATEASAAARHGLPCPGTRPARPCHTS